MINFREEQGSTILFNYANNSFCRKKSENLLENNGKLNLFCFRNSYYIADYIEFYLIYKKKNLVCVCFLKLQYIHIFLVASESLKECFDNLKVEST